MSTLKHRIAKSLLMAAAVSVIAGCAVPRAVQNTEELANQGHLEEAIDVLREAKKDNPGDMRLDGAMYKQVDKLVGKYYQEGEQALAVNDEKTALERFESVLKYDSGNMRARQAIDQIDNRRHLKELLVEAHVLAESRPEDALQIIWKVLEERPGWSDAIKIRDVLMRRVAEAKTLAPALDASLKKPVSLSFRSHNLINIFENISKLANVNFIFDADVSKTATASISAKKTTAEDAINLLLATNRLRKKVLNHNTLLIYPASASKDKEYRDMAVKTFFLSHASAKAVSGALKMTLKTRDVYIDERINAIVVRDAPETLELASRLVQALDRPEAEVTLDVQVLEVSSSDALQLGVKYPESVGVGITNGEVGANQSNNIPLNLLTAMTKNNVFVNLGAQKGVTLNLLQKATHMEVLANPKIRVKNGKKAQIEIGQKVPVITNLMTDSGATSEKVEMLDVGLKFDVLPTISLDGEISVDIDLTVSSLGTPEISPKGAKYYRVNQRKTKTTLTAKDNETQILAGLINREDMDNKTGLPGVSQMPLLDRLFGNRESNKAKSELVLVITPRIERKLELPGAHVTTFISGTESRVSQDSLVLRNTDGARLTSGGAASVMPREIEPAPVHDLPEVHELEELPPLDAPAEQGAPALIPPPLTEKKVSSNRMDISRQMTVAFTKTMPEVPATSVNFTELKNVEVVNGNGAIGTGAPRAKSALTVSQKERTWRFG
ncbi:secretin N-terminal domain-containing protein [Glaciimonas immobilis]|uniref:General secretion pathway protein D n=1 Tax=Glaciimonas immobilis TaxID=728004 RepID=A0A840RXH7_9BURK|nr:secretin N-terminal domain-containing protein [Glaciimonas immobilis]KAF3998296.1 bacterial type II and III secretion system family protein [Glaciimonas immobilis]MBB5201912.1 general secretion pathway protein D [Glaciimonas immobilis]